MRTAVIFVAIGVLAAACGSGGGGGGGTASTIRYVRSSGNDGANGATPQTAFRTLERAVKGLQAGDEVIVGPGVYRPPVVAPTEPKPAQVVEILRAAGTARDPIRITADPSGSMTEDAPGPVIVDGGGDTIGIRVSRSQHVIIDGFEVIGGGGDNGAGIQVRSESSHVTVQHCVVRDSADGIRVENTPDVLLFNNLIHDNTNRGVALVRGAERARLINNTIARNGNRGVSISGVSASGVAARGATLRNNILQQNAGLSIFVDDGPPSALEGYSGNFNLVYIPNLADHSRTYRPASIRGAADIHEDAEFKLPEAGLFALEHSSPAVDAGTEAIGAALVAELLARTTSQDGGLDRSPVDIGYHYPAP